jgi:hypothetical protein
LAQQLYSLAIFSEGTIIGSTGVVGPVVPAGFVYVVRDIVAFELTGATGAGLLWNGSADQIIRQWLVTSDSESRNVHWTGRQVYAEGEQVGFQVETGTWNVMASGYQLTLP